MKNILVAGGAGYIGSHTVKELIARGYGAVVVDNLENGHREAVDSAAAFYEADLRDITAMDKIFNENEIDAVIDFAAYTVVAESVADPIKYYENNVYGMTRLLRAMQGHGVDKIVFSSTASVYGIPKRVPIVETDGVNPINPYGETKLAVERLLKWADGAYGIRHVALRYFNVAGAHASGSIGEDHDPETHLIPIAILTALGRYECLDVYGDDYNTKDGTCIRDYVHVTDLAAAHVLAADYLSGGGSSRAYNIGSGTGFSNREIIDEAERVTGLKINRRIAPRRPGDPDNLIASPDRIMSELGWRPERTNLKDIISSAFKWHKAHPDGYGDSGS